MHCIVKQNRNREIVGWIIATDVHDARRQAEATGEMALASILYRKEFEPPRGMHEMPVDPYGNFLYFMLVA